MKVLFLNPRYYEEDYRFKVNKLSPPLGMAILANILHDNNHEAIILDLEALRTPIEKKIAEIEHFSPDVIGVFGTSPTNKYIKECTKILNESCPSATIIVGGPHATLFPEDLLNSDLKIDYIFRGESENSIVEFVTQLERHGKVIEPTRIPGIGYKTEDGCFIDSNIPRIDNLDAVSMPAYNLLHLDSYFESGSSEKVMTMMTSRGCPHNCIYCAAPILYGRKYRCRSPESVVREMRYLHDEYEIDHIVFYDANFNSDKDRVKRICRKLIEETFELTWRARVRADRIDEEMVRLMKDSGCAELSVGVETGSDKLLKVLKKSETKEEIKKAFQIIKEAGLWCSGYFMFGIPGETPDDAERTIEFAIELDPDWALFSAATPLPGTEFFNIAKKNIINMDLNNYKFNFNKPVVSYEYFTSEQIEYYINYAYKKFYLRKEWLMNRLEKAEDVKMIENIVNSYKFYCDKNR